MPITSVLWMVLKRLWHHRRLVVAVWLGFTVAVGVVTSIPLFVNGALTRVLEAELGREKRPGRHPAAVNVSFLSINEETVTAAQLAELDDFLGAQAPALLGVPLQSVLRYGGLDVTHARPADSQQVNPEVARWLILGFVADLENQVEMVDGRIYQPGVTAEGEYEVVVSEEMLDRYEFTVGSLFHVPLNPEGSAPTVPVRVVGAYKQMAPTDHLYPISGPFDQALLMDAATFRGSLLADPRAAVRYWTWYFGVDEADVDLGNLEQMLAGIREIDARVGQMAPGVQVFGSPADAFDRFSRRADLLRVLLLILSAPLLCLTGYYLLVTANLTVERQRAEIAVLRSRGAGMGQTVSIYLLEGMLVSGLALLAGPWLGLLLANLMGAAAGFVQFVNRKPLPLIMDERVYLYAAVAALGALLAVLIPGVQAARESIVTYKMQAARQNRAPLWQRYFLDILLLLLSLYGYSTQQRQHGARLAAVAAGMQPELTVDPLHFVLPALLIGSLGLVLLRLLPLLTRLFNRMIGRAGSASLYLAFTQVARSPGQTAPVILLLTLTVGLGLYGASAARTLEQNDADKANHRIGAEVALQQVWDYVEDTHTYVEPPFHLHETLPEVEAAARVYTARDARAFVGGRAVGAGHLMGIDTEEFARVARFRRDLYLPYHPFDYLNLLGKDEEAVLVHTDFMVRNHLQPGDRITLRAVGRSVDLVIFGAVDYWPTLYGGVGPESDFFIANLHHIQAELGLRPYEVWLTLAPGVTDLQPLTKALAERAVYTLQVEDARQVLTAERRDPQRTGLYGVLTVGFIVSAGLTVLGFLLYAVLSLRSRLLQLGLLRAMGLSVRQLLGALGLEQAYTVGVGMAAGTGFGLLAAHLFVPFLQMGADPRDQIPPFRIVTDPLDRIRLYAVLGGMLVAGLFTLAVVLSRMQIHQAVKLGEDA